jgi:hypothetical protein
VLSDVAVQGGKNNPRWDPVLSAGKDSLHTQEEGIIAMFKATIEVATDIAHDLNVRREFVWEIIKGMTYNSIEELEIKVCKAIVGH